MRRLELLHREIAACRECPRLVEWRERVARVKVARFRDQPYWGRPLPGFGDPRARILFVGLAPGAHGANRTGRMFTGDRSGDFLFAAMHRAGLANQPTSASRHDGLALTDAYVVCVVRCAPPGNAPSPAEIANCAHFLDAESDRLPRVRVVVALGAVAWRAWIDRLARRGVPLPRPRPAFAHGARADLGGVALFGAYHPSQQNTQTGRLTPPMFDAVLSAATRAAR